MPATFAELLDQKGIEPMITVFLPRNYLPQRKHPLLIFLGGGGGTRGQNPGVARKLTEESDFICVDLPLFKEHLDPPSPGNATSRLVIRASDGKFMWPFYRTMLARLEAAVPNIDPAHRILGGFSNGAHATAELINESDGEVARRFSGFIFGEGGGGLERYDLLKGKEFLMLYGSDRSQRRAREIYESAVAAGAKATLREMKGVGHAFPESQYPTVRAWLRGEAKVPGDEGKARVAEEGKVAEQTKTGTVTKVDVDGGHLTVMVAREMAFMATDSTTITQGGHARKLADIKAGDKVSVTYVREGDTRMAIVVASALGGEAASPPAAGSERSSEFPAPPTLHTATTHPMKYYISLPRNWSADRKWPVLVAPSAHYGSNAKDLAMFAAERDARKAPFILVSPFVINADRVADMKEYRGAVADAIRAADAADDGRDEIARGKFDSEGIQAVLKDVRELHHGEDQVYITGFSSSTHVAYLFLFTHPELLKGVVVNSGGYAGRGVEEEHIPLRNSPQRAGIGIKFVVGEDDPHYENYLENWQKTKAELLGCGHSASRVETEVIRKGNPERLNPGHNWFSGRILDFCAGIERTAQE